MRHLRRLVIAGALVGAVFAAPTSPASAAANCNHQSHTHIGVPIIEYWNYQSASYIRPGLYQHHFKVTDQHGNYLPPIENIYCSHA